jgi:hypothetical protein
MPWSSAAFRICEYFFRIRSADSKIQSTDPDPGGQSIEDRPVLDSDPTKRYQQMGKSFYFTFKTE